jgi:hypothetical protein
LNCLDGLESRDRVKDFNGGYNSIGVMRNIDVESGVHLFIRVIRGRVFYHRDLVSSSAAKRTVASMQVCAMSPMTMS